MSTFFYATAAALLAATPLPFTPVTTYSNVARDSLTGEMGGAVQSHCVGPIVHGPRREWARWRPSRSCSSTTGQTGSPYDLE